MVGTVRPGDVDPLEDFFDRADIHIHRESVDHLLNTLRAERVLGIDVDDTPM